MSPRVTRRSLTFDIAVSVLRMSRITHYLMEIIIIIMLYRFVLARKHPFSSAVGFCALKRASMSYSKTETWKISVKPNRQLFGTRADIEMDNLSQPRTKSSAMGRTPQRSRNTSTLIRSSRIACTYTKKLQPRVNSYDVQKSL